MLAGWGCPHMPTRPVLAQLLRLKKRPRVSNRDINDLMDRGAYTSLARSRAIPYHRCVWQAVGRTWWQSSFPALGKERPSIREE